MNVGNKWPLVIFAGLMMTPIVRADNQVDHLRDLAKQAKAKGDLEQVASYLCEAANLDAAHYQKRCDRARADAEKKDQEYEAAFQTGAFELQKKDYAGAIRDLSKVSSGPRKEEAQQLIQQAKIFLPGGNTEAASQQLLHEAQSSYQLGDFDTAVTKAKQVQFAGLQPVAKQLLMNIKIYQDTMAQADLLAQNADYKGAKEKYSFAIAINSHGPGSPAEKLQAMESKLASQSQASEAVTTPQPPAAAAKPAQVKVDYAAKVKSALAEARRDEAAGNLKGALQAFDAVLVLDGLQAEALAGKQRVMAKLRNDPKALAASLEDGIRNYYASHFDQAEESISLYLNGGGLHSKGAAHFYLAASLWSQFLLGDPHDERGVQSLQQSADEQFALARQENYKPIEKFLSPKILAEWTKSGSQK
jgi:hypothetical protein